MWRDGSRWWQRAGLL